ncbi:hypothetical protein LZ30DRAFT_728388 [Colletotrichum cereale]|nr:hypothetical protein LZ30DRAFT_728388 [Colletotrichum cereale]
MTPPSASAISIHHLQWTGLTCLLRVGTCSGQQILHAVCTMYVLEEQRGGFRCVSSAVSHALTKPSGSRIPTCEQPTTSIPLPAGCGLAGGGFPLSQHPTLYP